MVRGRQFIDGPGLLCKLAKKQEGLSRLAGQNCIQRQHQKVKKTLRPQVGTQSKRVRQAPTVHSTIRPVYAKEAHNHPLLQKGQTTANDRTAKEEGQAKVSKDVSKGTRTKILSSMTSRTLRCRTTTCQAMIASIQVTEVRHRTMLCTTTKRSSPQSFLYG